MSRDDDFDIRRKHLAELTEDELELRFWGLAEQLVAPVVTLARENTSPSIERSVLLRMGFSSLEARTIVEEAGNRSLLGHGAGHLVYRLSSEKGIALRAAGEALIRGEYWDEVMGMFIPGGIK
ncbi:MAG: ornithine aminomutase subunit alpha [Spirochaetales bacterium]|nr:ornithine aminomutase subunit alpha [Spirochaetales bacterium]